jgi:hypothetical protein
LVFDETGKRRELNTKKCFKFNVFQKNSKFCVESEEKIFSSSEPLNVHGTRIATKTRSVATGTAHKQNLNESARVAPLVWRAAQLMTLGIKIGLKTTIEPRESIFSSNDHTTMHHTPLLHAN